MSKPVISVIIPVYNVEKYLPKCLDSVIEQTYPHLEIVLIDDGSKDSSGKICEEYAAKDSRIKYIHQSNQGVSMARNNGMDIATGDYYHFLDSDDYLDLNAYEFLLDIIKKEKVDAVGFEYYITYPNGADVPHQVGADRYGYRDQKGTVYEHLFGSSNFLCTKLLPARLVGSSRLRTDIYRDEDTLFGLEILSKAKCSFFSERPLLHYVQSEDSACRGSFRVNQISALKAIPIMEDYLGSYYPEWINKWRAKYMHLMTTLYRDMVDDSQPFTNEKKQVYDAFCSLWQKGGIKEVASWKDRVKFHSFKLSPELYCKLSYLLNK